MTGQSELKNRIKLINSNLHFTDPLVDLLYNLTCFIQNQETTKKLYIPKLKKFYSSKFLKILCLPIKGRKL